MDMQKEELYYHYCPIETFEKIIESKSLWLTRIVDSNDSEEIERTLSIIWGKIKCDLECELNGDFEHIVDILEDDIKSNLYAIRKGFTQLLCASLTENRDLAQNWNEYADHGKGFAFGFSNELFYGIKNDIPFNNSLYKNSIGYSKVCYDSARIAEQIKKVCKLAFDCTKSQPVHFNALRTILTYAAVIKNPTYIDERETRIMYYVDDCIKKSGKNQCEIGNLEKFPIPHCALPWIKSNGICALKEIIIGRNSEYTKDDVRNILDTYGIKDDIKITESEYSYQFSKNRG